MPETVNTGAPSTGAPSTGVRQSGLTLSTDGKRHPVQLGFTAFTLLAGIVGFAAGLIVRQHLAATVLGAASMVAGLYTQMISTTRPQRILLMAGVVAGFVGVCLGIAHGGFS
jgi:ammonia channel protein AmtB